MTTVWPGATLVTTDGDAVVDGEVVDDGGEEVAADGAELAADETDVLELGLELEALPPAFATLDSVPDKYTE